MSQDVRGLLTELQAARLALLVVGAALNAARCANGSNAYTARP
jgi:hypothetical protein